jgi:hypothetical protein
MRTRRVPETARTAPHLCVPFGSASTLTDVVAHYNRARNLGLTAEQQRDLAELLKSL